MPEERESRLRILGVAQAQFFALGFTRVTMDAIAAELGMSKKTLYAHFSSKHALLQEVMRQKREAIRQGVDRIVGDAGLDFGERLMHLTEFIATHLSAYGPFFLNDLKRNAPDVWAEMEDARRKNILGTFSNLVAEGVSKGVFRQDVNRQLLVLMYANLVQSIVNPEALAQLPLSASQAFEGIVSVMLTGILTDDARQRYDVQSRSSQCDL